MFKAFQYYLSQPSQPHMVHAAALEPAIAAGNLEEAQDRSLSK
jgi:hypothetical protein